MQQLLETAMDEKTHTPENIDAVHQAIKESAIGYGLCSNMINYVSNDSKAGLEGRLQLVPEGGHWRLHL